jgi:heptosyltransferase-2
VALFGPTVPAFGFGPLATARRVAEVPMLECRPCDTHGPRTCPLKHWRCMRDLTVAEVLDAVDAVRAETDA